MNNRQIYNRAIRLISSDIRPNKSGNRPICRMWHLAQIVS